MRVGNMGNLGILGKIFTGNNILVALFTAAAVSSVQGRQGETVW